MSAPSTDRHDPYAALAHPTYRLYLTGSFLALFGRQMSSVAVTWEIYQWTHSATALGLVGLINVLPVLGLSLPAGVLADRADRRGIIAVVASASALLSVLLALVSWQHARIPDLAPLHAVNDWTRQIALLFERDVDPRSLDFSQPALPLVYAILFAIAVLRILGWPARSAIIPLLLPAESLSNAITWNSSAFEIATMAGPALGGFLVATTGFPAVYLLDALMSLVLVGVLTRVTYLNRPQPGAARRTWRDTIAGAEFIWRKKVILGASSLDLFAVLLGGATTLLPIYADKILHVDAIGFGWLRAAPSVGAFSMAMWQAHRRPLLQPGRALLWAVGGFGAAIVVFGLSSWFWLSLVALFFTGAFDNISVVVRQSLVQLLTPDNLRGRVTSVNQIFVGSSNEIGALRAGLMAALFGPVTAVVAGGVGTLLVVATVARTVPALRRLAPLGELEPEP
jgi:MFS family permease